MDLAQVFTYEHSKAIKLPQNCQINENEMVVRKLGDMILLVPQSKIWDTFMGGINGFTDDFMVNGRVPDMDSVREEL